MTEPRSKSETLSETTKSYLDEVYINEVYGRKKDISNKYIEKGLAVEEDAITLLSRVTKTFFKKNEDHLSNEYIKGTPDLFKGSEIQRAEVIRDIKASWDIFTFFKAKRDSLNMLYYWQLQGYMALTGASKSILTYCLVDTPEHLIMDETKKLAWKMGVIDPDTDTAYNEACTEIMKNSIYADIAMKDRVHEIEIERNEADIERLYKRIAECREYMNATLFNEQLQIA